MVYVQREGTETTSTQAPAVDLAKRTTEQRSIAEEKEKKAEEESGGK
eukprot:CAMPEP_0170869106 /NCGR_PEP_ID=MMETSP0734-20130129/24071_1 /TAXON_ID=186038 /ORGANISM="Fragilariopsis kerguelensis, Strain L26-C5" /LENGTH=46 /DNA_ID= /DNA_START= /DNA_END= /DNA_ORIENTATION=